MDEISIESAFFGSKKFVQTEYLERHYVPESDASILGAVIRDYKEKLGIYHHHFTPKDSAIHDELAKKLLKSSDVYNLNLNPDNVEEYATLNNWLDARLVHEHLMNLDTNPHWKETALTLTLDAIRHDMHSGDGTSLVGMKAREMADDKRQVVAINMRNKLTITKNM